MIRTDHAQNSFPLPNDHNSRYWLLVKYPHRNKTTYIPNIFFCTQKRFRGGRSVSTPYFKVALSEGRYISIGIHKYGWSSAWTKAIKVLRDRNLIDSSLNQTPPLLKDFVVH